MADGDALYLYKDGKRATVVEGSETDKQFREQGWSPQESTAEATAGAPPSEATAADSEPKAEEPAPEEPTPIGRGRRRGA